MLTKGVPDDAASTIKAKQRKKGIRNFWSSLEPVTKVGIITAVIAAIAAIVTAIIKIVPEMRK